MALGCHFLTEIDGQRRSNTTFNLFFPKMDDVYFSREVLRGVELGQSAINLVRIVTWRQLDRCR